MSNSYELELTGANREVFISHQEKYEDGRVRIYFDSGKDTWLAIDVCVKNHLLLK